MTSYMNILVSVRSERAMARIAALKGGLTAMQTGVTGVNRMAPLGQRHISSLMKFGNQLQWTGRMLQYNFTLPLLLAGGAAFKFAMDQEKAFTHVAKVYGDTEAAAKQFQKQQKGLSDQMARDKAARVFAAELEALDEAFTAISNHYGVQKAQVNEVAGAWAAAGASGLDLAKSVDATMKAIIIGDMDAAAATKALISIQAQYNLSTSELMGTLADLNSVENQTGASMQDLITAFEKSAGVARSAGIETDQLAAYVAALVPASGSAASAGNALKTIISRLMSPTKEAKQVMEAMGLEVTAMSWQSATASERLKIMANEFESMGQGAKNAASSVIASRWQVNRFEILMDEITKSTGYYRKALESVEDQGESYKRMQKELNTVLESSPRALQRALVGLQNAGVEIIQPLIPHILYLADSVAEMTQKFASLDPHAQKFVLFLAVGLALVGPVVRYMGALTTLFGVFGKTLIFANAGFGAFIGFLYKITFFPILKALSTLAAALGGTTGLIIAEGSTWMTFHTGLAGFYSRWNARVAAIFAVGNIARLKNTITFSGLWMKVTRESYGNALRETTTFFGLLNSIWTGGTTANVGAWSKMWLSMEAIQLRGMTVLNAYHAAGLATLNKNTVKYGLIQAFVWVWKTLISMAKTGFGTIAAVEALYNIVSNAETLASETKKSRIRGLAASTRALIARKEAAESLAALEAGEIAALRVIESSEAARTFAVDGAGVARVRAEQVEQAQRIFLVDSGGSIRAAYEEASESARTLALGSGTRIRGALEAAEQTQRTFVVDSFGTARAAAEAAEEAARTAYTEAGAAARVASETINEGQRVFIVDAAATARVASERAAEVARVIAVTTAGEAMVTTEAAVAAARAHAAGVASGRILMLETGEAAERTAIANLQAVARLAAEAEAAAGRLFIVDSTGAAILATEAAALEGRLGMLLRFAAGAVGIEAEAQADILAITVSMHGRQVALWQAYYAYLLSLQAGYNAAMNGLAAGATAERLALEAGSTPAMAAAIGQRAAQVYAIESGAAQARTSLVRAQQEMMVAAEAAGGASRAALAASTGTALVATEATTGRALVAVEAGTAKTRLGIFARMKGAMIAGSSGLARLLLNPYVLAAAAIIAVLYIFRDDIKKIWQNIVAYFKASEGGIRGAFEAMARGIQDAFYSLPQSVQGAMVAVVSVVRDAALAVYNWFQYINPWAHHSPSLVENVRSGVGAVIAEMRKVPGGVKGPLQQAYAEIKKFGQLTANISVNADVQQQKDDRKTIKKAGGSGAALASYDRLAKLLDKLNPKMLRLQAAMEAQQKVVDKWQAKLDRVNQKLDKQQGILDNLQDKLDKYQGKLDDANDRLTYFASAPLKGMQEMEDQIFANQMAQTRLRYEMMQFEDVNGTYDELTKKIEAAAGAAELFRGAQNDLRAAGAGSEILGVYDKEIGKLDQQVDKYKDAQTQLAAMQASLAALQREAEKLDLIKAMKFDELQYEIDKAANAMKELTFEEIMAGIQQAQSDIEKYTDKVNDATAAVVEQQAVVDALIDQRDEIQAQLDLEQAKLDAITDRYNKVAEVVSAIGEAMANVVSDAQALVDALEKAAAAKEKAKGSGDGYISPGLQNFLDAGNADFPDPGGKGIPPRTDWESQAKDIEKWTDRLSDKTANMFEDLNPFKPIKEKALQFWDWLVDKGGNALSKVGDFFSKIFDGVGGGGDGAWNKFKDTFETIGSFLTEKLKGFLKVVKWGVDLIWPEIKQFGQRFWDGIKAIWEKVAPEVAKFKDLWEPLKEAIHNIWTALKPVLLIIAGAVGLVLKVLGSVFADTIKPVMDLIGDVIGNVVQIIRGVVSVIIAIFTGDWKLAFQGALDIVLGTVQGILRIFEGLGKIIWGVVKGVVTGIYDFFVWLWDVLVGHSVVPDIVNGIIEVFGWLINLAKWVWENVLVPIYDFFVSHKDEVVDLLSTFWDLFTGVLKALWDLGAWMWEHVLKPVYNFVKSLWDEWVKPALSMWWDGIKTVWNVLKTLAIWYWENVLKPVFDKVKALWEEWVKPALQTWWEGIKNVWNTLKDLAIWVWENVLKPVFDKVKDLWTNSVKPELDKWKDRITGAWENLKTLGTWIKDNVMDPVFDKFKEGWNKIKDWFEQSKDMLTKPARAIVGAVVDAINFLINGLNKVADILPGFSWHIDPIEMASGGTVPNGGHPAAEKAAPFLAAGGNPLARRVGGGFKTNGARAIVGEGKANHPEFVIPTDPTYRHRAVGLLMQAAAKLNLTTGGTSTKHAAGDTVGDALRMTGSGVPGFFMGGIIGGIEDGIGALGDLGKDVFDYLKDHATDAVSFILKPFRDGAMNMVGAVDWDFAKGFGQSAVNSVFDWALKADKAYSDEAQDAVALGGPQAQIALAFAQSQVGKPYIWGGTGPDGYDCSGFMSAVTNVYRGKPAMSGRLGTTATFPWAGFRPGVGPLTIGSTDSYAGGVGHMAGTIAGVNIESAGGIGVRVGGSARGYNDSGFDKVYQAAEGGIAKAKRGGLFVNVAEAGQDEAIIPLPRGWKNGFQPGGADSGSSETNINIYGNLEFPNITNASDAEVFIQNLKSLAGGSSN